MPNVFPYSEYSDSLEEYIDMDIDNTEDDNFCKYGEAKEYEDA